MATVRQTTPAEIPSAPTSASGEQKSEVRAVDQSAIDQRFEALLRQVKANRPSDDIALIRKAW
jgi:hypothetical protein